MSDAEAAIRRLFGGEDAEEDDAEDSDGDADGDADGDDDAGEGDARHIEVDLALGVLDIPAESLGAVAAALGNAVEPADGALRAKRRRV